MTNHKHTKRALLSSMVSLVLCFAMLLGTTFAWFTDTASTSVNKIQAGTLKVALLDKNGNSLEGQTLDFVKAEGHENEAILWEPGATYNLQPITIKNEGNLALKYQVVVTGINGDAKLNEVIDWTVDDGQTKDGARTANTDVLKAGESAELVIEGHMNEKAGNEYQGLSIDNVSITVLATQASVEYDSNGNQYDVEDALPSFAATQEEFNAAIANATDAVTIALPENVSVTLDNGILNGKALTVIGTGTQTVDIVTNAIYAENGELNYQRGSKITFENVTIKAGEDPYDGIVCDEVIFNNCTITGKVTLYGKATFVNCTFNNTMDDQYSIWTWGGTDVLVKDCVFNTNGKAILLYGNGPTDLTVDGCVFVDRNNGTAEKAAIEIGNTYNATYSLTATNNIISGFAITSTGTKMYGNKDSMDAEHLTVTLSNNVEKDATVATTAQDVVTALTSNTEIITVYLTNDVTIAISDLGQIVGGSGHYQLGGTNTKAININLGGHKLTLDTNYWSALGAKNSNAVITVKNGSVNSSQTTGTWNSYDLTFYDCDWNFENVVFDKAVALATGADTTMKNVTINETHDYYALWITAEGQNVTLNDVTINSAGRAIAIKEEYVTNKSKVSLNISNSKITSAEKAAVLVTSTAGADIKVNNVDISKVTADTTNFAWIDEKTPSAPVTITGATVVAEP